MKERGYCVATVKTQQAEILYHHWKWRNRFLSQSLSICWLREVSTIFVGICATTVCLILAWLITAKKSSLDLSSHSGKLDRLRKSPEKPSPKIGQPLPKTVSAPELFYKSPTRGRGVWGVACLGCEIFIVLDQAKELQVYDIATMTPCSPRRVYGFLKPWDMASCETNNSIFILDREKQSIFRRDSESLTEWPLREDPWSISIGTNSNVIVSYTFSRWSSYKLNEFTADGEFVRSITLSEEIRCPRHVDQLPSGQILVAHGAALNNPDNVHRVCLVDENGSIVSKFDGERENIGKLDCPYHIIVLNEGFILVADCYNNRVLLMTLPALTFVSEYITPDHKFHSP